MVKKYNKWTKIILEPIIKNSISYAECLRKMGLKAAGGNYKQLQRSIDKFNISDCHLLGQSHNRGKEIQKFENLTSVIAIKKRLLSYFGHSCQKCKNTEWLGYYITLEIEHIDGNNRNNTKENLMLLCPNCHAQTKTWKNKKR